MIVNRELYAELKTSFNDGNSKLWKIMTCAYLIHGSMRLVAPEEAEQDDFKVWFTANVLKTLTGSPRSPKAILKLLKEDGWTITDEKEGAQKATRLTGIDHAKLAAWKALMLKPCPQSEKVDLKTGKALGPKASDLGSELRASSIPEVEAVRAALNTSSRAFSGVAEVVLAMQEEAVSGTLLPEVTGLTRERAIAALGAIVARPQPAYQAVQRSARLFPHGDSFLTLPRAFRKELCLRQGWRVFDLKSIQAAIIAKIWDIPSLRRVLRSKRDGGLWNYLAAHVPVEKDVLKTAVYSIIFGASTNATTPGSPKTLFKANGHEAVYQAFLDIDVIKDMIKARERQRKLAKQNLGAVDAFGNNIQVYVPDGSGVVDENSVLAAVVQSHEVKLMTSIFNFIDGMSKARVMLWIHDGLAIDVKAGDLSSAKKFAREEAKKAGFITELEEEELRISEPK